MRREQAQSSNPELVRPNGQPNDSTGLVLPPPVHVALKRLQQANAYAVDARRDAWDFAVEIRELLSLGLAYNDLRWLVCKGYVAHALETTVAGDGTRRFQHEGGLVFAQHSCVILTQAGEGFLRNIKPEAASTIVQTESLKTGERARLNRPHWDAYRHELRSNGFIVKQFKVPSANQETILAAFEEDSWPPCVDDPLPPQPEQDPRRRLHDTIKSLNRNQKHRLIRFMGNGSGQGVRWEYVQHGYGANHIG
jgi:hypothetical protein